MGSLPDASNPEIGQAFQKTCHDVTLYGVYSCDDSPNYFWKYPDSGRIPLPIYPAAGIIRGNTGLTGRTMKPVEIISNGDGTYSVRVFDTIIFTGTREECDFRVSQESQ